ncbi:MAG: sulfatase-like hydrolase/transferase [Bacteroidota bacterium]
MWKPLFLSVFIGLLWLTGGCESPSPTPPNLIFLFADDLREDAFGAMGHPFHQSPNIDQLIQQGVRFRNTYAATPVCAPSRVSLFLGLPERVHGVGFSSSYQLTEAQWQESYPALLRKAGYHTGFVGKFGVEYYSFRGQASEQFDYWWGHDGWTRFFPKRYDSESTRPYHRAADSIITPIMGEAMEEFLEQRPSEQPFCLSVSFSVPHSSQTRSMYDGYEGWRRMARPANEHPSLAEHPIYGALYRQQPIPIPAETGTDPYRWIPQAVLDQSDGRDNTYAFSYDPETCREHHIRYAQTITGLDQVIGDLMASLEAKGLAENTVIIFASDHGLLMGEYGMGGKSLLYDLAAKIPCFIYDPRLSQSQRGTSREELVSSLDVTATMLAYAGVEPLAQMEGESLLPLLNGQATAWREALFLESLFTLRGNPFCEGIRQGDWKYIRMFDGVKGFEESDVAFGDRSPAFEQLFHLKEDPEEKHNLIADYEGSEWLEELRQSCRTQSEEINQRRERYRKKGEVRRR